MEQRPITPGHRVSPRSQRIRIPFAFLIWQASSVLTACRRHTGTRLLIFAGQHTGRYESLKGPSRVNAANAEMPANTGASNECQRSAEHLDSARSLGSIPVSPTLQARESLDSKPASQSPCHAPARRRSARALSRRRELLNTTLLTWLEVGGSACAAGAALFSHPNRVRGPLMTLGAHRRRACQRQGMRTESAGRMGNVKGMRILCERGDTRWPGVIGRC
jgi:hypothetical protein